MKNLIRVAVGLFVLLIMGMWSSVLAAGPYLLMQVDGVTGDSKIIDHKGWIEIMSFNQELTNLDNLRPDFGHFNVYKRLDISSVQLANNVFSSKIYPKVTIDYGTVVEGNFRLEYQVVLENVFVKYIAPDVSKQQDGEAVVFESMGNATVAWTYKTPKGTVSYKVDWN